MMETVSMAAAAEMLSVSRQAVHQAVRRGTLPAVKGQGGWRIDREAVNARIVERPVGGRPPLEPGVGFLSATQTALWFGVTTSTVYRWIHVGLLQGEQRGDSIVIPLDNVLSFKRPPRGRPPVAT